jgi:hypothetical protein
LRHLSGSSFHRFPGTWSNRDRITDTIDDYQKLTDAVNARLDREWRLNVKPQLALSHFVGTYFNPTLMENW